MEKAMNFLIWIGVLLIVGGTAYYFFPATWTEKIKGWKTVIWNMIVALFPVVLESLDKLQALDLNQYLTPVNAIIAGFVIAGVGVLLRLITTGPVGSKGDEAPAPATKAGD